MMINILLLDALYLIDPGNERADQLARDGIDLI